MFFATFLLGLTARAWRAASPPTSSSLAEGKTPLLAPPQHGGARHCRRSQLASTPVPRLTGSRNRAWNPPTSSSLAEGRTPLLAPLSIARSARCGWRSQAAAFLTRSQTKSMSARSIVQDSGAPAWLSTAARDLPTLAACIDSYAQAHWLAHAALGIRRRRARHCRRLQLASTPMPGLLARAWRAWNPPPSSLFANEKACSLIAPPIVVRAIADACSLHRLLCQAHWLALYLIARCRSLRIAPESHLLRRRSLRKYASARFSSARRRAIRMARLEVRR